MATKGKKTEVLNALKRPYPPAVVMDEDSPKFAPAPEVGAWVREEILTQGGAIFNPDHAHLEWADIAFLWAPNGFTKQGRTVLGQCEEVTFRCGPWQKGRQVQQMNEWFGRVPAYLITLDAQYCATCSDLEFCALVEHELFHIGQQLDEFGQPAFNKEGLPKLQLRSHDVEEFIGVVKRYGATKDVARMVEAAKAGPELAQLNIARACGTCLLKAA
ncbi:putative metallopeptidase [Herbaspirillum sp.]|uniref:putative metallopeptidase n=1 Tax=Herbaspirillum sp. TaxID=1890675 RepID=UPI000C0A551B|nr:putative metallopeptidase [Herbaspirillum sp.]MAF04415.1 hypothetical protein [Herbaspirillum sp.]MBO18298.1 hypothetical protein [Herbaspirillum sp.]|tara:strand:- start:29116 stop:29763 length:648 start_codon:yes stop_codon:yes gene_type:complete